MNNNQLELGFQHSVARPTKRHQRALRAQWWFQQMRRAVDWQSPAGRPEQIQLIPGRKPSLV